MKEKGLNIFISILYLIGVVALLIVINIVPVSAETLTRNLDSQAVLWESVLDSEDIRRVPETGFYIIQDKIGDKWVYQWGPTRGYSNPQRWKKSIQYSAYEYINCTNGCDVPIAFNIIWHKDIPTDVNRADLWYQNMIAWILNNYNYVYINFTDTNNKTWHTKLNTRVLSSNQTTDNGKYVFDLNIYYTLTLYNVKTINYIQVDMPSVASDYQYFQDTFGSDTYAFATLETQTFAYAIESYTGGTNGTDGVDSDAETIQGLQQETNEKLNDIRLQMLSESMPDTLGLGGSAGWLPAGPVDSILNLPLTFFNGLNTALTIQCQPVNAPIPFVQNTITIPCINTLFAQIPHFNGFWTSIGLIASAFILYKYLLHLYQWVDDTLTFRENNWQDWGGI